MKKSNIILIIIAVIICIFIAWVLIDRFGKDSAGDPEKIEYSDTAVRGSKMPTYNANGEFNDGLGTPYSAKKFELDELGEGVLSVEIFNPDINKDGKKDRITRTRYENGTAHFYYDYKIELAISNEFMDITVKGFRTIESADCSLQKIRFIFSPKFTAIKISRPWQESWDTETLATKSIYGLSGNSLREASVLPLKQICNVSDLF